MVGQVYNNCKVLEYKGNDNYKVGCLGCGNTEVLSKDEILRMTKKCDSCKLYKFDIETSKEIYDKYTLDNIESGKLSKEYGCNRITILNMVKRIERINDIEDY